MTEEEIPESQLLVIVETEYYRMLKGWWKKPVVYAAKHPGTKYLTNLEKRTSIGTLRVPLISAKTEYNLFRFLTLF